MLQCIRLNLHREEVEPVGKGNLVCLANGQNNKSDL